MNSQDAVRRENLNSQFEELRLMLTHTGCSVSLSKVCAIIKSVFSIFLPFSISLPRFLCIRSHFKYKLVKV